MLDFSILKRQNPLFKLINFEVMSDVFSKDKRSEVMSKIRSKNTKPEIIVRKFLFAKGFRFRIHDKKLPGKPDIVLKKFAIVIFINGCFWHGHINNNCRNAKLPKSNAFFWKNKIIGNMQKDERNINLLKELRWNVITIWECQLKGKFLNDTLESLLTSILGNISNTH